MVGFLRTTTCICLTLLVALLVTLQCGLLPPSGWTLGLSIFLLAIASVAQMYYEQLLWPKSTPRRASRTPQR